MSNHHALSTIVLVLWAGCVVVLGGCAFNRAFIPEVHKVQRGESLSTIAAQYGLNWHNLARWNHIPAPYTIYVGQRLSLDPFPPLNYGRMRRQRHANRTQRQPRPRSTVAAVRRDRGFNVSRLPEQQRTPRQSATREPADAAPLQTPASRAAEPAAQNERTVSIRTPRQPQSEPPPLVNERGWRWPLATSLLRTHKAEPARHGINLYGVVGTPVYAARAGHVVYSGAGLQGFGQLVIIKHAGEYLSAYGYVQNLRVEEGDRIAAGQHIADMGMGPGSRAQLHFEIRHEGEPIDPTSVLPDL